MSAPNAPVLALGVALRSDFPKNATLYFNWQVQAGAAVMISRTASPLKPASIWEAIFNTDLNAGSAVCDGGLLGKTYIYKAIAYNLGNEKSGDSNLLTVANPKAASKSSSLVQPSNLRVVSTNANTGSATIRFDMPSTPADRVAFKWISGGGNISNAAPCYFLFSNIAFVAPSTFQVVLPINLYSVNTTLEAFAFVSGVKPVTGPATAPIVFLMPNRAIGFTFSPANGGTGFLNSASTLVSLKSNYAGATWVAEGLPSGITLTDVGGGNATIGGTPTLAGSFTATVTASSSTAGGSWTTTVPLVIATLVITNAATLSVVPGTAGSLALTSNPNGAVWSIGSADENLTVQIVGSALQVIALTAGVFTIGISAILNNTMVSQEIVVTAAATAKPVIDSSQIILDFSLNKLFAIQPSATNFPSSWTATGLPDGVEIDSGTGMIDGAIAVSGIYNVTLSAANSVGISDPVVFSIRIGLASLPVIIPTTSVLGYQQWQNWAYQPAATNDPTGWTSSPLPPGMSLDPGTGLISGACSLPGVYLVNLTAFNADGAAQQYVELTIGIDPAAASNKSGVDVGIDTGTGAVTVGAVILKEDDDLMFYIQFTKGTTVLDLGDLSVLQLAIKQFEPDDVLVLGSTFAKVASGSSALYQLYVKIDSSALTAALSNYAENTGTQFSAECEIEWQEPNVSGIGPTPLRRSTALFTLTISRNINP